MGQDETAFANRDSRWAEVIVGVDPDPANAPAITDWTKSYWEALHPYSAGGAYVNFLMHDEGGERVKATYRGQLRPAGGGEAPLRPGQPVPGEPEHRAVAHRAQLRARGEFNPAEPMTRV